MPQRLYSLKTVQAVEVYQFVFCLLPVEIQFLQLKALRNRTKITTLHSLFIHPTFPTIWENVGIYLIYQVIYLINQVNIKTFCLLLCGVPASKNLRSVGLYTMEENMPVLKGLQYSHGKRNFSDLQGTTSVFYSKQMCRNSLTIL